DRSKLTGRIRGSDREPLATVTLTVRNAFGISHGTAETDEDGRYTVEDLAAGDYTLEVRDYRRNHVTAVKTIRVTAGEPVKKNARLKKGRTVKGKVLHRGKGVRGVAVRIAGLGATTTNAKGKFVLKHIPNGKHVLEVEDLNPGGYLDKTKKIKVKKNLKGVRIKVKG